MITIRSDGNGGAEVIGTPPKDNGIKGCTFWLTRAGLDWLGKELNIHIFNESR